MLSHKLRIRGTMAICIVLSLLASWAMPGVAIACEGAGEEKNEGPGELIEFGFRPGDITWLSKEKGSKNETIELLKGEVKLLKQSTNDEKDFEATDPNGCMGKSLVLFTPCTVVIKRKTEAVTGVKRYVLEYEEEGSKLIAKDNLNLLEGR